MACLVAICAGVSTLPAHAVAPVEGLWGFGKGRVEVTPGGASGLFKGVITKRLRFSYCPHPRGERMWNMLDMLDGTYRGRHVNYIRQGCKPHPNAPALWRVRKTARGDMLDFCANDPEEEEPEGFGPGCNTLSRVAPARDLARSCAAGVVRFGRERRGRDVCVHGPLELRTTGCLRRRGAVTHRFVVKIAGRKHARRGLHPRARIKRVRFTLDGRSRGSDRGAPFQRRIRGRSLQPGRHLLAAEALLRSPGSKKPLRRTVRFDFDACA